VKIYTTNYKKICQSVENALGRVNATGPKLIEAYTNENKPTQCFQIPDNDNCDKFI